MSNPFTARITQAAQEGYLPAKRTYRTAPAMPVAPAPATPRQLGFMEDLMTSRRFDGETRPKYRARVSELNSPEARTALTREAASKFIDYLLTLPKVEVPKLPQTWEIPVGRYAVEINETLAFVKVERPEEGRWAGYTFVTRQLGDEFVRVSREQSTAILNAVRKAGVEEAMTRYGRELGVCGECGRTLTNEESRAAGIGPVCRAKNGW